MLYFARLGYLLSVWPLCAAPGLAEIGTHACEERLPHFLVVQFAGLAESVQPWVHQAGLGVGRARLLCFHSLGGGEKHLFCILFPLSHSLGRHHP